MHKPKKYHKNNFHFCRNSSFVFCVNVVRSSPAMFFCSYLVCAMLTSVQCSSVSFLLLLASGKAKPNRAMRRVQFSCNKQKNKNAKKIGMETRNGCWPNEDTKKKSSACRHTENSLDETRAANYLFSQFTLFELCEFLNSEKKIWNRIGEPWWWAAEVDWEESIVSALFHHAADDQTMLKIDIFSPFWLTNSTGSDVWRYVRYNSINNFIYMWH